MQRENIYIILNEHEINTLLSVCKRTLNLKQVRNKFIVQCKVNMHKYKSQNTKCHNIRYKKSLYLSSCNLALLTLLPQPYYLSFTYKNNKKKIRVLNTQYIGDLSSTFTCTQFIS